MAKRQNSTVKNTTELASKPTSEKSTIGNRCRVCDATDLVVLRKISEQEFAGHGPDGKPYTSIIRRRVQCRHCGQVQMVMQRVFDPMKWK